MDWSHSLLWPVSIVPALPTLTGQNLTGAALWRDNAVLKGLFHGVAADGIWTAITQLGLSCIAWSQRQWNQSSHVTAMGLLWRECFAFLSHGLRDRDGVSAGSSVSWGSESVAPVEAALWRWERMRKCLHHSHLYRGVVSVIQWQWEARQCLLHWPRPEQKTLLPRSAVSQGSPGRRVVPEPPYFCSMDFSGAWEEAVTLGCQMNFLALQGLWPHVAWGAMTSPLRCIFSSPLLSAKAIWVF